MPRKKAPPKEDKPPKGGWLAPSSKGPADDPPAQAREAIAECTGKTDKSGAWTWKPIKAARTKK